MTLSFQEEFPLAKAGRHSYLTNEFPVWLVKVHPTVSKQNCQKQTVIGKGKIDMLRGVTCSISIII